MKCLACSAGVKRRVLTAVPGVEACEVEFESGTVPHLSPYIRLFIRLVRGLPIASMLLKYH